MIFNIKTQGRIFQKVNYDVLKKNYVSKEKKRNQDDNCFHQGHNRMKKMKLLKAQISSKESNPNSFVLNKSCSKSGINGNNQISREDLFRKNIERKNLIKKSFYIESKLNSDVSENISMNGLLNLTPNTLIKNKSNPLLVKYKSNQKRNLNDNRENLNFLSSNDDKKDQFRSSSNNIINTSYVVNRKKIDNNIKKQCLEKKILDDKEFISKGRNIIISNKFFKKR